MQHSSRGRMGEWYQGTSTTRRSCRRGFALETLEGRCLLATFTTYPVTTSTPPTSITTGPDGNLWFVGGSGQIGNITPSGTSTLFTLPSGERPAAITAGGDGNLWFTDPTNGAIGKITTSGQAQEFTLPANGMKLVPLSGITKGPDGNVWFVGQTSGGTDVELAKITPAGVITEYPSILASPASGEGIVSVGSMLAFTYSGGIGESTTTGTLSSFPFPTSSVTRTIYGITADAKGDVWFLEAISTLEIGELTTTTGQFTETPLISQINSANQVGSITFGSDGNLYFPYGNQIGQVIVTQGGVPSLNQLQNPNAGTLSGDITKGPDGNIWYTQGSPSAIVTLSLASSPTSTPTPTPTTTPTPTPTPTTTTPTPTPTTTTITLTPTPTSSLPFAFTGSLSPASDSGVSSSDGITNDNEPNFIGTAPSGSTVTLFALPSGSLASPVAIGQEVVPAGGTWSITPTSPLADGAYLIAATAFVTGGSSSATIQILPSATEGNLVIDTAGPTIGNVSINPPLGQIAVTFQARTVGLDTQELLNPGTYVVTGPNGRRDPHVAVAIVPGTTTGTTNVVLTLDGGRGLRHGRYTMRIRAAALGDVAGNRLNGSFYFGFPTGTATKEGDFVMTFQTDGISATTPTLPLSIIRADASYLALLRKHLRNEPV